MKPIFEQYNPDDEPIKPKKLLVKEKLIVDLESTIKQLQAANDTNTKIIKKMERDITRLKDQISELAGKISRG
jgi:phage shock protein A